VAVAYWRRDSHCGLPKEARAGDAQQLAESGPVGAEEGAQFLGVELGIFERREVPAARGLREPHEVALPRGHVDKTRIMTLERHGHGGGRAVPVLGHDKVRLARPHRLLLIEVLTVQEDHDV
jgi:hypothetical protein